MPRHRWQWSPIYSHPMRRMRRRGSGSSPGIRPPAQKFLLCGPSINEVFLLTPLAGSNPAGGGVCIGACQRVTVLLCRLLRHHSWGASMSNELPSLRTRLRKFLGKGISRSTSRISSSCARVRIDELSIPS